MSIKWSELKAARQEPDELDKLFGIDPNDPEIIEARKRINTCKSCGADTSGDGTGTRLCINRCCVEWICATCGFHGGSGYGPVGCRCSLRSRCSGPNPMPRAVRYLNRRRKRSRKS